MKRHGGSAGRLSRLPGAFYRAWLELTPSERRATALVIAIFMLGVIVRWWHICRHAHP